MWINIKGLIARINAAVSVKFLTQRQRSKLSIHPLVGKVANSQVLDS